MDSTVQLLTTIFRFLCELLGLRKSQPPPPPDPFQPAFEMVMKYDGAYKDSAPGEKFVTHFGIVPDTWQAAAAHGVVSGEFDSITWDQAEAIYRADYWNKMGCGHLHPAVGFVMFCDATLTGTGNVVRLAQRICGATVDGAAGPETWQKISAMDPADFVQKFIDADGTYLQSLASAPKYINGWMRREHEVEAAAMAMIEE